MKKADEEDWLGHARWVRGLARDVLRDAQRAEDVSQEALLAAWRSGLTGRRDPVGLRRWLAATARNLARMTVRSESNRRAREIEASAERASSPNPTGPSGEATVDDRIEMQRRVAEAVAALAPEDREVVVLRYFDGLAPREIAQRLNTTPNAVSTRLSRARAKLRRDLGEHDLGSWAMAAAGVGSLRVAGSHAGASAASAVKATSPLGPTWIASLAMKKLAAVAAALISLVLLGSLWLGGRPRPTEVGVAAAPGEPDAPASEVEVALADLTDVKAQGPTPERADVQTEAAPSQARLAPEEVEPPSTGTGALLVRVISHASNEPLADVGISVTCSSASRWYDSMDGSTDASGERLFPSLPTGTVSVRVWRMGLDGENGPGGTAEVVAGDTARLTVRVDGGDTIRGRVVDENGRGVAGAEIWMSEGNGGPRVGLLAAYANGEGRFRIPHTCRLQAIGARSPGMQPSLQEMPHVFKPADPMAGVTLVLKELGGELKGRVVATSGNPVANAVVKIDLLGNAEAGAPIKRPEGIAYAPASLLLRTDENGSFSSDRLGSGAFRLVARGRHTDVGTKSIEIAPGGSAEVEITVGEAASLMGTITDHLGQPVPGAHVTVTGADWDLAYASATTDAAGNYAFPSVISGELNASVFIKQDRRGIKETLITSTGQTTEWSPSIPAPLAILGRAFSADGVPLYGFHVRGRAREEKGPMAQFQVDIREDGTFEAPSCLDAAYDLSLQLPGQWMGEALLQLTSVPAGSIDAEFVLDDARLPTASLSGSVLDPDGEAVPLELTLEGRDPLVLIIRRFDDPQGEFQIPHLPPGDYKLTFSSDGHVSKSLDLSPTLAESEARILPALRLEAR